MRDLSELRAEVKFDTKEIQEALKIIDDVISNKDYTEKEKYKILYYISIISKQLIKDKVEWIWVQERKRFVYWSLVLFLQG